MLKEIFLQLWMGLSSLYALDIKQYQEGLKESESSSLALELPSRLSEITKATPSKLHRTVSFAKVISVDIPDKPSSPEGEKMKDKPEISKENLENNPPKELPSSSKRRQKFAQSRSSTTDLKKKISKRG